MGYTEVLRALKIWSQPVSQTGTGVQMEALQKWRITPVGTIRVGGHLVVRLHKHGPPTEHVQMRNL